MAERVALHHGVLTAVPGPRGFTVRATLPLPEPLAPPALSVERAR
jgi:hypothetical protein